MSTATLVMNTAQAIFLITSLVLAVYAVRNVHHKKHKKQIMLIKQKVFIMLIIAIATLTTGMMTRQTMELLGMQAMPSAADLFLVLSYASFAAAFAYFWSAVRKLHKLHPKDSVFMLGVTCGIIIWLYYLFQLSLIPRSISAGPYEKFLMFYYPLIVALMFLLTLRIHPTFRSGLIRTPLWYMSHGVFTHFLAFNMYAYSLWNTSYGFLTTIYTALYLISSIYFVIGFWAAKKKYR